MEKLQFQPSYTAGGNVKWGQELLEKFSCSLGSQLPNDQQFQIGIFPRKLNMYKLVHECFIGTILVWSHLKPRFKFWPCSLTVVYWAQRSVRIRGRFITHPTHVQCHVKTFTCAIFTLFNSHLDFHRWELVLSVITRPKLQKIALDLQTYYT